MATEDDISDRESVGSGSEPGTAPTAATTDQHLKTNEDAQADIGAGDVDRNIDDDAEVSGCAEGHHYLIAKNPGYSWITVHLIVQDFGALHFIERVNAYLHLCQSRSTVSVRDRFPVTKTFSIEIPGTPQSGPAIRNVIRARRVEPRRAHQGAIRAHFDTVLAREDGAVKGPLEHPLDGLLVGQIRLIFRLPEDCGRASEHPLVYIQWFTPFRHRNADMNMYSISRSRRHGQQRASIIPLPNVERSVHLIPQIRTHVG